MTHDELDTYARARWGDNWVGPLAKHLDINKRTVARWKCRQNAVPNWVRSELDNPRKKGNK